MRGGFRPFEKYVPVHPYRQRRVVILGQIAMLHKQVVVEAVIAARIRMISRYRRGMRFQERRLAVVEGKHIDRPGEQVVCVSATLRIVC